LDSQRRRSWLAIALELIGEQSTDRLIPIEEAARIAGRGQRTIERWLADGLLRPYKKPRDRRTHVDLAELPEAMRRAGRPGPKPKRER
jgi:hypothetical protein